MNSVEIFRLFLFNHEVVHVMYIIIDFIYVDSIAKFFEMELQQCFRAHVSISMTIIKYA